MKTCLLVLHYAMNVEIDPLAALYLGCILNILDLSALLLK